MFEEFNRANAEIQAKFFGDLANEEAAGRFEKDLRGWLHDTQIKQAAGLATNPMPVAPLKIEYYLDPAPSTNVRVRTLPVPVSNLTLADIMPRYGTDANAVGNGIGGPIPGEPNKFYMASDDKRAVGLPVVVGGSTYIKVQENPFKSYYLKVA